MLLTCKQVSQTSHFFVEKGEQVKNCLGKPVSCLTTKIPASSNKTSKNEGEELVAVLVAVQEEAKTVKWWRRLQKSMSLREGDLGADGCSFGSTTCTRRASSQLTLLAFSFEDRVEKLKKKPSFILKYLDYKVWPIRYRNPYVQKYS